MSERRVEGYKGISSVENAVVYGLDESIRRAKFPMATEPSELSTELTKGIEALALSGRGEGHDQWLTGVIVQFDLSISNKMWVEMERYHFVDFVSSQSTMHRITKFDLNKMYNEYVEEDVITVMRDLIDEYNDVCEFIEDDELEDVRDILMAKKTKLYLKILYNNPAGCTISAGLTTNYRQLKTIYFQRRNHRLPEWREFCQWIETLPYSYLITGKESDKK